MEAWGQVWWQVWITSIGLGFALLALSIAVICILAEINYKKKKPLAGKHEGQRKI